MAIQQINLGSAPSGAGGDTQRAANTKVNQNFSNSTHAASRLVGTASGQIPLAQDAHKATFSVTHTTIERGDCDDFEIGSMVYAVQCANAPASELTQTSYFGIRTERIYSTIRQTAFTLSTFGIYTRMRRATGEWTDWRPFGNSRSTYYSTTASNPNVYTDSQGLLQRSTSSIKYKDLISQLELDDESYQKAMKVKPIVYRSKADADPKHWHFLSFSAEELGEYDPALTQWKTHEIDPDTGEQVELEQKEAEGINLNAICAVLHATNIKQAELIRSLEDRVTALEAR